MIVDGQRIVLTTLWYWNGIREDARSCGWAEEGFDCVKVQEWKWGRCM